MTIFNLLQLFFKVARPRDEIQQIVVRIVLLPLPLLGAVLTTMVLVHTPCNRRRQGVRLKYMV